MGDDRFIRSPIPCKRWLSELPAVEEVRPSRCPGCGGAGRPEGEPLGLHGHGLRARALRGASSLTSWGPAGSTRVLCRRFQCQSPACRAVILVGPAEVFSHYRFFGVAIALALWLWAADEEPPGAVWARSTGHPSHRLDRPERWRSLSRWGRAALRGTLFRNVGSPRAEANRVDRDTVRPVLERLLGQAGPGTRGELDVIRVMAGAVHGV